MSWIYAIALLFAGAIMGIFFISLVMVAHDEKGNDADFLGRDWKELNDILNRLCRIEDRTELTKEEQDAFDVGIQCVAHAMNKARWRK